MATAGRRLLSTAAKAEAPVTVPLKLFGIHARYASAAFVAASKANLKPQVEMEFTAFKQTLAKSPALKSFVQDPTIKRDTKVAAMEKLFDKGSKASYVTKNTFMTLAANARLSDSVKVIDSYLEIMKADRKEVDAIITSAEKLDKKATDDISKGLISHLKPGDKIKVTTAVDPALIAGITIQIGNSFLDLSAASKIATLKRKLL